MTADNERQAEIEAAARAMREAVLDGPSTDWSVLAVAAIAALDRARDARHGDEAWIEVGDDGDTITAMSHQDSWQPQGRYYLARFPQGEDHETGERWTMIRRRDWPNDQGSLVPRGAPVPKPDEHLEVFEVARVPPARDARHGTTTAEDIADFIERYPERWGHGPARLAADIRAEFAPGDTPHPTDTAPVSEQNADGG